MWVLSSHAQLVAGVPMTCQADFDQCKAIFDKYIRAGLLAPSRRNIHRKQKNKQKPTAKTNKEQPTTNEEAGGGGGGGERERERERERENE